MEHDSASENTLKKGAWSQEEDKLLIAYVKQHGEGNWNAVQKHSGLSRCANSCRLRWLNHLRPDLKKGAFTEEEEKLVTDLHASYGSKWALMALQLPVSPDGVREKVMNTAAQSSQNTDLFGVNQRQEEDSEAVRIENSVPYFKFLPPPIQDQSYYESLLSRIPPITPSITDDDFMKQMLSLFKLSHLKQELVNGGFSMNVQSPPVCNDPLIESNPEQFTYSSPPEPLIHGTEILDQPPDPSFNPHQVPNDLGVPQSNLMPVLQSDNTFVQVPFTDPTPPSLYDETLESIVYGSAGVRQAHYTTDSGNTFVQVPFTDPTPSSLYDETLESIVYGSAGVRQEPYATDSGSQHSQLGYKELEPASTNTTGELSLPPLPPSSDEDWINELFQHVDDDSLDHNKT